MLIRGILLVCVSLATFASTITARAGEAPDIFAIIQLDPPASPPGGRYLQTYTVGLDMEAMQQPAPTLTLNLPGREPETVQLVHWEPRQGYIQIPDPNDPTGLGSITIPDPTAKPEDFWWRWYGKSENYTVALTVVQGVIAGRITSANHRYAVEPRGDGLIRLGVVNSEFWRTHPHDPEDQPKSFQAVHADSPAKQVMPASSLIGTASTRGGWDASCSAPAPGGQQVIDVLLLYSEGLLSRYFGNTASVHAVLQASIDDANQSLRNSNISGVVFSPRGPELLPNPSGFDYDTFEIEQVLYRAAGVVRHLGVPYYTFPGNSYVSGRRDTQWADIVAVARDGTLEGTCGVSFANRVVVNNDYETEPGPDFEKFAYIVLTQDATLID